MRQVLERNFHYVASPGQPRMRVSYRPLHLEAPRAQPSVRQPEPLTTMVVLQIVKPNRASVLEDRAVPRYAVRHPREQLGQVERRVCIVTDAEEQHLSVQVVHPAYRAFGSVGRKGQRAGGDPGSLESGRREGL